MSRAKLKVAAVGTGYFSQFHYDAWSRCDDVELLGIVDLNLAAAQEIATQHGGQAFSDCAQMLDAVQPDLLDIITPPPTHLDMISLAAERGINVICQKPFCGGLDTAKRAVDLAEAAKIDITVHENFRFQPWYAAIKDRLDVWANSTAPHSVCAPGTGRGRKPISTASPISSRWSAF